MDASNQRALDNKMIAIDGTDNKFNLGGNAVLGASVASAKAAAKAFDLPLYEYFRALTKFVGADHLSEKLIGKEYTAPVGMFNVINGGKHVKDSKFVCRKL